LEPAGHLIAFQGIRTVALKTFERAGSFAAGRQR